MCTNTLKGCATILHWVYVRETIISVHSFPSFSSFMCRIYMYIYIFFRFVYFDFFILFHVKHAHDMFAAVHANNGHGLNITTISSIRQKIWVASDAFFPRITVHQIPIARGSATTDCRPLGGQTLKQIRSIYDARQSERKEKVAKIQKNGKFIARSGVVQGARMRSLSGHQRRRFLFFNLYFRSNISNA